MAPWLIITGLGLDLLSLLLQSLLITINYNNSQSISSRTLLPWLPRTRSILVLVLRLLIYDWTTYIHVISRTHRKHICCPAMDICEPHRKHLFLCCIYSTLNSNGSCPIAACVFVVAEMCLATRCLAMGTARTTQKTLLPILFLLLRVRISGVA
jgi:hypothetical protein